MASRQRTASWALVFGTLAVGTVDAIDAVVLFGARGATPVRIFQSIASGLLGRAAFRGGLPVAGLGVAIHYFVAFGIVTTYFVVSRRAALLRRHWAVCGMLYGIVAYGVMNLVVIPLSAIGPAPFVLPLVVNGIAIHMFGIGIPSAWFASRVAVAAPRA
ncbi:MAG TPA: hypothetical protein VHU82_00465 [Vicinamibacterales bacterium]|jgi:hypothetical protein|nr:hypothetical protein [Vicinamibacterales bacterium]